MGELGKIAYPIAILLLLYGASVFSLKRLKGRSLADDLLVIFLIATSQQVLTGWTLGMIGELRAIPLFIFNLLFSTLLVIFARPDRADLIAPFRLVGNFFGALGRFCRRPEFLLLLLVNLVLMVLHLARGIVYPPYSWDGVHYHFGQVGFMIQDGHLGFINSYPMESYPRNIELTYLWNTIFHRHQVYMNCLQALFIIPAVLACYGIARKAGCGRRASALTAMAFPAIPIVFLQATTGYIDIAVSALLLCALNFLLVRRPHIPDMIIAGLAFGLLIGAKGFGVIWMAVSVIGWIIIYGLSVCRNRGLKGMLILIVILIAASLPNGVYIYARNWAVFGNPAHPYSIAIGDMTIFEGSKEVSSHVGKDILGDYSETLRGKSWLGRMYLSWSDPSVMIDYDGRMGGFGPIFFLLLLPAYAASILISLLQKNWRFLKVIILLTIPLIATWQLSWWSRYSIYIICAGLTSFAYITRILASSSAGKLLRGIFILTAVVSCFLYLPDLYPGSEGWKHFMKEGPSYWHSSQFSVSHERKELYRKIYPHLKPGTTIMVDTSLTDYWLPATGGEFMCFWNLNFSNRVAFAGTRDPEEWLLTLIESRADFVLTDRNSTVRGLIDKYPGLFIPFARDNEFVFYNIDPEMLPTEADLAVEAQSSVRKSLIESEK